MTTEKLKRAMYLNLPQARTVYDAEAFENALEAYLEALRQDQDDLRNRLQAFEFANKACGEELRAASELIQRQRKFIRTLYTSRKARKPRTLAQIKADKENASQSICGALPKACQHAYRTICGSSRCVFCMKTVDQEN